MFARVVTGMTQTGRTEEATSIYQDKVIPAAKAQKGYRNASLLTEPTTGKFVSITFWDTQEDMAAGEASGYFRQALALITPILAGQVTTERFEVAVQD